MYPSITPLDIMPYVIFWIPWLLGVFEVCKGLKYGVMTEYYRRGTGVDSVDDERRTRQSRKEDDPWNFFFLFNFYVAIIIVVPVLTAYSILSKIGWLGGLD